MDVDNGNGGGNRSNETKLIHQETATEQTIQQMTNGFMALFEDKFDQAQDSLKEAFAKQETIGSVLERLNSEHAMEKRQDGQELFFMMKDMTDQLHVIKKRMLNIHQRVKRLKNRSKCLEKHREKELNIRRQKQIQEEDLIAKPNTN